jgi:hypothetical protein
MSQIKFEQSGVDAIAAGVVATGNTHKARIIDLTATSNLNKAITGATNATPIALTITAHGWSVGDILIIQGVLGNTSANGTYRIKVVVDANTVSLQTLVAQGETPLDVVGNGAYTSGGRAFNVSRAAASSTSTDIPVAAGSSTDQTLTGVGCTKKIWTATVPQWPSVAASTLIGAIIFFQSAPTDRAVYFTDGKQLVRLTASAAASTTLQVEPLYAGIPNGTALVFSNGVTATLSAVANAGDTTLTVGSVTIPKGHTADAPITGANLPVTTASGSAGTYTFTTDATFGLFTL